MDKDVRRRLKGKKKEPEKEKAEEEDLELEEGTESSKEKPPVGKVVDITI
ncbi:MAG: hypothetical protein NTX30_22135 [Deltaproteobacteria bacterium]|nr:hypothetical protein [Deltaproteobacteria bacterium]